MIFPSKKGLLKSLCVCGAVFVVLPFWAFEFSEPKQVNQHVGCKNLCVSGVIYLSCISAGLSGGVGG